MPGEIVLQWSGKARYFSTDDQLHSLIFTKIKGQKKKRTATKSTINYQAEP